MLADETMGGRMAGADPAMLQAVVEFAEPRFRDVVAALYLPLTSLMSCERAEVRAVVRTLFARVGTVWGICEDQ